MNGFTGLLPQSLGSPVNPELQKQLGMVQGSAQHLQELIKDEFVISRIEAQQLQISRNSLTLRRWSDIEIVGF